MDKNAIKKYALWARRELISRVSQRALQYGVSEKESISAEAESVHGHLLSDSERRQRKALIARIEKIGYEQTMEEAAYTWFNRFTALRFMEVNGYLPTHVRVFTDEENGFKPQILTEAIHLDAETMPGLDMDKVYAYKDKNQTDELFKYLIVTQCNALISILPGMFTRIDDYTELLFPDNLLREGSVVEQMVTMIPEDDWKDAVQIIGWLYQYYNTEPKDKVFADLKKNIKISKDKIPAATQLFTPDWIVRYMVENSLGRLAIDSGQVAAISGQWSVGSEQERIAREKEIAEKYNWKYYIPEAEQSPEVRKQLLAEHCSLSTGFNIEKTKTIDPCMGSGHILAYMFDVLVQIYESCGYTTRDAVKSIVENNLYGLDIDDRAAQLAYFAVMMKARQYDRRFFNRGIQPHVYAICESNGISADLVDFFCGGDKKLKADMASLITQLRDAKEYGSILNVTPVDFDAIYDRFDALYGEISMYSEQLYSELLPLVQVAQALAQKYDVVVTNPPYMGSSGMSAKLGEYVKKEYPDSKSDLFAVFIERCGKMTGKNCYQAMITQHAWMFLSGFEKLRIKIRLVDKVNMIHLGARAFEEISGEVVQTTSFVFRNTHIPDYLATYVRLVSANNQQEKEEMFSSLKGRYVAKESNFTAIPCNRISYWINGAKLFGYSIIEDDFTSGGRNKTHNNELYVRVWWEIETTQKEWRHYDNGGSSRKWYGNCLDVVNWSEPAKAFYASHGGLLKDDVCSKMGISWNGISGGKYCFKIKQHGFAFSSSSPTIISANPQKVISILALLNSCVAPYVLNAINPTLQLNVGEVLSFPVVSICEYRGSVDNISRRNIETAQRDWDSFETSWDFQCHPLVSDKWSVASGQNNTDHCSLSTDHCSLSTDHCSLLIDHFNSWSQQCITRFNTLKANEEELNRIFIDIYGLQDELTPEVEDKDVTVRKADKKRDIRSLISYAVGCMFGRYSLDVDGLAYAGGDWDCSKYTTFPADRDNVIPICDDEYFDDDIVGRFVRFIETVYGKETLEENLHFIADALGGSGQPRDVIRNYFLNDFYADHLKIYQKRPIYWLFDSGKKGGFKALIYMHRYQPDTIARIRTDYVFEQQARYRTAIADLEQRMATVSTSERVKLTKQLQKLREQDAEIRAYEEKIHHLADRMISIDLDDGVKHNYEIFKDVLAPIK